ncbi:MAG: TPM domain-containing protein [Maritimibacter sp.]|nr:TPM domain-containing protein [Maritimibacter sp.]
MIRPAALALALILPALASAQGYPDYDNIWLNDQAEVIDEAAEARITQDLQALADETGVQATVLTLRSRWGYPGETLEEFATGLFNAWGIGDASRNDGILVLVLVDDREMRVELGSGYAAGYDAVAKEIIDTEFIPAFGRNDFSGGIERGTGAVIARIAREQAAGNVPAPVADTDGDTSGGLVGGIFAALFALLAGGRVFGRRITDRFSRCPSCGERGIHSHRETLQRATRTSTGRGEKTVTCPHCGYENTSSYTIPRITRSSSSSSGSFGGGSSSGGGASGRW